MNKRIALLATGDELVNGDILNTNGQAIAQALFDLGMEVGMHLVVADQQAEIENAIQYLLTHHKALIITGGLGPTSDDRTRFALAKALNQELILDESCWEAIQARLNRYTLTNQPISNKNQALFPQEATIIPNDNGTAAGCYLEHNQKVIFMLPGPPSECLPMFKQFIIPQLQKQQLAEPIIHKKWLLFNVSEGEIADRLDTLAAPYDITTGYRINFPYVEFKAHSKDEKKLAAFLTAANSLLQSHQLNPESLPASQMLINFLMNSDKAISLDDQATKGYLLKTITTLNTYQKIFNNKQTKIGRAHFELTGIPEY